MFVGLNIGLNRLTRNGETPAWSPSQLFASAETGAWYDPSDLTSMFQDSTGSTPAAVGSPVGKINDKSGNGNHLVQATSASRPTLRQSGSLYYLEFDGDDYLEATSASVALINRYVVMAASETSKVNGGGLLVIGCQGSQDYESTKGYCFTTGTNTNHVQLAGSTGVSYLLTGPASALPLPLQVLEEQKTGGSAEVLSNGSSISTDNSFTEFDATSTGGIVMGGRWTGAAVSASQRLNGHIYGMIIRGATTTGTDALNARTWMATKAGITL